MNTFPRMMNGLGFILQNVVWKVGAEPWLIVSNIMQGDWTLII